MIEEIKILDKARIPVLWLVTHEETRAEAEITKYALEKGGAIWIWSLTSKEDGTAGWISPSVLPKDYEHPFNEELSTSPATAITSVINYAIEKEKEFEELGDLKDISSDKIIVVFRDPHAFLHEDIYFIRALRDAKRDLVSTKALIICISPVDKLPIDLQKDITVVYPGLPNKHEIKQAIEECLDQCKVDEFDELPELVETCVGLTVNQTGDAIAQSLAKYKKINLKFIQDNKTKAISSIPGLKYIGNAPSMDNVGGLAGIKEWIAERKEGFTQKARDIGLPTPKGVLCLGPPGTGKSLFAKAVSTYLETPLIRLNLPDLKGSLVGETEGNIRQIKDAIEGLNRVVVWIDEIEKGLSKTGRNLDGGTSDAILSGILDFLQEREGESFVVATANNINSLPPELLRKGRWDAIFFIDFPSEKERVEIFKIHLGIRNWKIEEKDIKELARQTKHYSGAEIEAACEDGMWQAFGRNEDLTAKHILDCITAEVPLYTTMKDQIAELRNWAKKSTRSASIAKNTKITKLNKKMKSTMSRKLNLKKIDKS